MHAFEFGASIRKVAEAMSGWPQGPAAIAAVSRASPLEAPGITALSERFYLPQLDGLRFIAFLLVFLHHQSPANMMFPVKAVRMLMVRLNTFGWIGVDVFFCLSSFLITSLLLREYQLRGTLSLKRFYIRRALRIWPLYYFVLLLMFLIFPAFNYLSPPFGSAAYLDLARQHLFPFAVFLGNFSYAHFQPSMVYPLAPLWSISVEEQFYLVWPVLIMNLGVRRWQPFAWVLCGMLCLSVLTRIYIMINGIPYPMIWVNTLARLDPFVCGTAVAFFYARAKRGVRPVWAILTAVLIFVVVTSFPQIGGSTHTIWQLFAVAVACSALLIWTLYSRAARILLGNPVLRWAGKLSYGFYVFHIIGLTIASGWYSVTAPPGTLRFGLQVFVDMAIGLSVTVLIASISYYGLERWFLILKDRFAIVQSRAV